MGDGDSAIYAGLSLPYQVWYDTSGNMYFAQAGDSRIRKVKDGVISTIAGTGVAGYFGDGGIATNAVLGNPAGIVGDKNGYIYISDFTNNRIRVINSTGTINLFAGNGTAGWAGDGYSATLAEISQTGELGIDTFGNVFKLSSN